MTNRDTIEDIKNRINIVNYINKTVPLKNDGGIYKGATDSGSASGKSLNVDPRIQLYNNFATGDGGDIFNWIAYTNNLDINHDFKEILKIAADEAGIKIEIGDSGYSQRKYEISTFLTAVSEHYRQNMTDEIRSFIYNMWGIEYKTIDEMRIGLATCKDSILDTFSGLFDDDIIKSSGMVIKTRTGWHDTFKGRIVFPYWKNGKVVFNIGRKCEYTPDTKWEQMKYKKQLTHSDKNPYVSEHVQNVHLFGEDSVRSKDDYILISEGIADCIMAIQRGIPSISPVTTNISDKQRNRLLELVKRKNRVYICNDNEENQSGMKGALRTAKFLQDNGIYVQIVELPM